MEVVQKFGPIKTSFGFHLTSFHIFFSAFDKVTDLFKPTQDSFDKFVEGKLGQKIKTI